MFTGIIESKAKVLQQLKFGLMIERPVVFDDIKIGSSIAVSGVCLSIAKFDDRSMTFDVVPTTLQKSKLGTLVPGDIVNLERALLATGRFDGHIVLGHCEGIGKVLKGSRPEIARPRPGTAALVPGRKTSTHESAPSRARSGMLNELLFVTLPSHLISYIVPHGSVALDGVSLTIAALKGREFTVALVPHTLKHTTLGRLKKGDSVNIETDILAKYILTSHATR